MYMQTGIVPEHIRLERSIMEINVTNPAIIASDLEQGRNGVKVSAGKTGEAIGVYSGLLDKYFDLRDNEGNLTTKWFDRKGKLGAEVTEEKAKFKALFPEAKKGERPEAGQFAYGTGDVYWQRCKIASGYETPAMKAAKGEKKESTLVDMCKAELLTMLNRINKARATKPEGIDTMLEVYEEILITYCTIGGKEDDLK